MYQWIESIRIENGVAHNIELHQKRMDETLLHFSGKPSLFNLCEVFSESAVPQKGLFKARLLYNVDTILDLQYFHYEPRKITSFCLVVQNELDYSFKYADRSDLEQLKNQTDADEIIIVQDGFIADTSYSNLIFLKNGEWYTPQTFLLNGTMRQQLLLDGSIKETEIGISNLGEFSYFKLINAMMPPDKGVEYPMDLLRGI